MSCSPPPSKEKTQYKTEEIFILYYDQIYTTYEYICRFYLIQSYTAYV